MDEQKLSPKTLLEQEAGRRAVAQRAMADAVAVATTAKAAEPAEPDVVVPAPKSSKKHS